MPSAITTNGDLSANGAIEAEAKLLERAQFFLTLERFGQVSTQEKNKGTVRRYTRVRVTNQLNGLAPATEGLNPVGQKLVTDEVLLTLNKYHDTVFFTSKLIETHQDGAKIRKDIPNVLGESAALVVETLRYDVLKAGSQVLWEPIATATERAHVAAPITFGGLALIERALFRGGGSPITELVAATAKIDTTPVAASFFAVMHPDLIADLRKAAGTEFTPVERYADSSKALPNEVGKWRSIRFLQGRQFTPWLATGASGTTYLSGGDKVAQAAAADVYPVLFFARNAYAIVPLQGYGTVQLKAKEVGTVDSGDTTGERGFVSWVTWQGTAILNEAYIIRYEVACTAAPTA